MDNKDGAASSNTLFSNVRSKISNFHPADLLPNFTFMKRRPKNAESVHSTLMSSSAILPGVDGPAQKVEKISETLVRNDDNFFVDSTDSRPVDEEVRANSVGPLPNPTQGGSSAVTDHFVDEFATVLAQSAQNSAIDSACNYFLDLLCDDGKTFFDFGRGDTLERQHFGTFYKNLKTAGKRELGTGHQFEITQLTSATFCDKCGDFIWGLYKQAVRCQYCSYTCHYNCQNLVALDCRSFSDQSACDLVDSGIDTSKMPNSDSDYSVMQIDSEILVEQNATPCKRLPENLADDHSKLLTLIANYNKDAEGLKMTVENNGTNFRGFVQIFMNFSRPISVVAGDKPSSIYDVVNTTDTLKNDPSIEQMLVDPKTITSFFLPRNSAKILHIESTTTTRQLIAALLKKFKVADNPLKFALYERDTEPGQTLRTRLRRFPDDAYPLQILLSWGSKSHRRFVLQENDTGDILWHYFEAPELENFLKILDREESLYIAQIKRKFDAYRFYIQTELRERGQPVTYHQPDGFNHMGGEIPKFIRQEMDAAETPLIAKNDLGSNQGTTLNNTAKSSSIFSTL